MKLFLYATSAISFLSGLAILAACLALNVNPVFSLPFMVLALSGLAIGDFSK